MQQTLQQNRFTGAAPMMRQGGNGAAPMMAGRLMSGVGGMTGSLTSGLEDLKKTAGALQLQLGQQRHCSCALLEGYRRCMAQKQPPSSLMTEYVRGVMNGMICSSRARGASRAYRCQGHLAETKHLLCVPPVQTTGYRISKPHTSAMR
jgi:hypothetical protein